MKDLPLTFCIIYNSRQRLRSGLGQIEKNVKSVFGCLGRCVLIRSRPSARSIGVSR